MKLIYIITVFGICSILIISLIAMHQQVNKNSVKKKGKDKIVEKVSFKKEKKNVFTKNKSKEEEIILNDSDDVLEENKNRNTIVNDAPSREKAINELNEMLGNEDLRNELNDMMKEIKEEDDMKSKLKNFATEKTDDATNAIKTLIKDE